MRFLAAKIVYVFLAAASIVPVIHGAPSGRENASAPDGKPHTFSFGGPNNSQFHLDGKPFQIRSAEIHPQRIPAEYWRHRLRQAKAMGLNTISIYIMWAGFEQSDGSFDLDDISVAIGSLLAVTRNECCILTER